MPSELFSTDCPIQRYLVIPHDRIVFPATRIPIMVRYPEVVQASISAYEHNTKIFVVATLPKFDVHIHEDPDYDSYNLLPNVGTLCLILRTKTRDDGLELLIEGQKRAFASAYQHFGEMITAFAIPDSGPGIGRKQGEKLTQQVDELLLQIRWGIHNAFGRERLIDTIRREKLDNPSHYADFVTFLLSLTNRISFSDQQTFLETFSVKQRFSLLIDQLTLGLENQQFEDLLRKRVKRFAANQFTALMDNAAIVFLAERKKINPLEIGHILSTLLGKTIKSNQAKSDAWRDPAIKKQILEVLRDPEARAEIERNARMTLNRRQNHILQYVLEGIDVLIASLYLQARGQIKKEISRHLGKSTDREELRKNRDVDLKYFQTWVSQTLGIKDGREPGSRNKPKPVEAQEAVRKDRESEMLKAMCEILKTDGDDDKLTKRAVISQMRRSPSTVYEWFRQGLSFARMKDIALIMHNDRPAFTKWKRTGEGFDGMVAMATTVYEKNFG